MAGSRLVCAHADVHHAAHHRRTRGGPPTEETARARSGCPVRGHARNANAITDVAGVEVGLHDADLGRRRADRGQRAGPYRRHRDPAARKSLERSSHGRLVLAEWQRRDDRARPGSRSPVSSKGPVFITNTHSVGVVRDASIAWGLKHGATLQPWSLPVVAETWDGTLNDINGFHVKPEHVFAALDGATAGPRARRQRRRRNRDDLLRVQVRDRHCVAEARRATRADTRLASWCRRITATRGSCAIAGVPVGAGDSRAAAAVAGAGVLLPIASWLDHHRRRHRRAAAAAPARTHRTPRVARPRAHGRDIGQQLRRHLHRVLDRQRESRRRARRGVGPDAVERSDQRTVFSDGSGNGRSDRQRAGRRAETMTGANGRVVERLPHETLEDAAEEVWKMTQEHFCSVRFTHCSRGPTSLDALGSHPQALPPRASALSGD